MTIIKRSNFHRELQRKMLSFRFEVEKKEDHKYVAKVAGQDISAEGENEADAVRNVRKLAEEMFKDGRLSDEMKQNMV